MTGLAFSLPTVAERARRLKKPLTDDWKASLTAAVVDGAVERVGEVGGDGCGTAGESTVGASEAVRCSRMAR